MFEFPSEREDNFALKDHIHLREVLTTSHNSLPCNIQPTVQTCDKKRDKFITSISRLKSKHVVEISSKSVKQLAHQFESQSWLQLIQKVILLNDLILVMLRLRLYVLLDITIEQFWYWFA